MAFGVTPGLQRKRCVPRSRDATAHGRNAGFSLQPRSKHHGIGVTPRLQRKRCVPRSRGVTAHGRNAGFSLQPRSKHHGIGVTPRLQRKRCVPRSRDATAHGRNAGFSLQAGSEHLGIGATPRLQRKRLILIHKSPGSKIVAFFAGHRRGLLLSLGAWQRFPLDYWGEILEQKLSSKSNIWCGSASRAPDRKSPAEFVKALAGSAPVGSRL